MKKILLVLMAIVLSGCATMRSTNALSLGMTKQEVIKAMGTPDSVKARGGQETLEYILAMETFMGAPVYNSRVQYWVILENGKVVQYGRAGDFSSSLPSDRRSYDINVNQ